LSFIRFLGTRLRNPFFPSVTYDSYLKNEQVEAG